MGRHRLDGPFVTMANFGPPSTTFPEEVDPDGFTYSSADPRFEAVNVYYAIDTFQRYLQDPTRGPAVTTAHNSPISRGAGRRSTRPSTRACTSPTPARAARTGPRTRT